MATPFSNVYSFFLSKISDYSFLSFSQVDLEDSLLIYLKSAVANFESCKANLTDRNDASKIFNATLSEKEQNIIATLMVIEYLRPKVVTSELYKQSMSDPDYKMYSQANHIAQLLALYSKMESEAQKLMSRYSYSGMNLDNLS